MAGKKKKSGRPLTRDWDKLKALWYQSEQSLTQFCTAFQIPISTAKKHLFLKDKKAWQKQQLQLSTEAKQALLDGIAETDPQLLVKSMRKSVKVADDLMRLGYEACYAMKDKSPKYGGFSSAGDAGRLALQAARHLEESSSNLQGIPDPNDEDGWQLSKGFRPHWYQRDFIFDLPSQTGCQLFVFHGGIGSGKTLCGAQKFGDLAWMNRGCKHIVAAPTYRMLEDTTKATFLDVLGQKNLSYTYKKTDNKIIIFGDTHILFRSMEKPHHLRGPTVAAVWIDEGGQMKDDTAYKILVGRVRDPHARQRAIIVTTTPDGLNWLYDEANDMLEKGMARLYGARTQDNISLPEDYIELVESSFDEKYAKQELGGEWLNVFAGQAYWAFGRADHLVPANKTPYIPGLPLVLCCDFNVAPMCWNVGQEIQGVSYVIDEIHIDGTSTEEAAREFKKRWGHHKAGIEIYGDASGWYKATSSTTTDYEILKTMLEDLPTVSLHAGRSNPEVKSRIAAVNGRLRNMKGHRKLFISEDCTWTVKDFEKVKFKAGTQELDKSNPELTHHTDAIGYWLEQKHPLAKLRGRYS